MAGPKLADAILICTQDKNVYITTFENPISATYGYLDGSGNWVSQGNVSVYNNINGTWGMPYNSQQSIRIELSPVSIVDDSNTSSITYAGSWTHATPGSMYYNNTQSYTNTTNDYAQFTFTGTSVKWVGARASNRGKTEVWLDGVDKGSVDQYASSSQFYAVLYDSGTLSNTSHTIKIVCTGTKNASSSNYYTDLDYFSYD